jgi:allantoate deiminase
MEGSRFPAAMLTSRAVAGMLDEVPGDGRRARRDAGRGDGRIRLLRPMAGGGRRGALAYLEAHIEQGPVLEAEGLALGT